MLSYDTSKGRRRIIFLVLLFFMKFQMLGYGWAGLFRKYLVDSPYMWWPSNHVEVSLFRFTIRATF